MQTLVHVNPLKPGKLDEYKIFANTITNNTKEEYIDLLKRYGLKNTTVSYNTVDSKELVMVVHEAEDNALELLAKFADSSHPYDKWFIEQLNNLHDFGNAGASEHLFNFNAK